MAAQPRLQSRAYQTRIVLLNLLALVWLAAAGATGVLVSQTDAKPSPAAQRLDWRQAHVHEQRKVRLSAVVSTER